MTKEFYESPQVEVAKMETGEAILEGSGLTGQDYNPINWTW